MTGHEDLRREVHDVGDSTADIGPPIDWSTVEPADAAFEQPDAHDVPTDLGRPAPDHVELLSERDTERLDPSRTDVPVSTLHPDRLAAPSPAEQADVRRAWAQDARPESWIESINPRWADDALAGRPGHTENCADCARSVQATLDGHPTAAGTISADGLPLRDHPADGGEHPAYTEQWAGRHAEIASYREIGERVADSRGSAIVFAHGDGGHAFNAVWSPERHRTLWVDGQTGELGDWPPDHLRRRMPDTRAIFFPEPRRPR